MFSGVYSVLHLLQSDGIIPCYFARGDGRPTDRKYALTAATARPGTRRPTLQAHGRLLARHGDAVDADLGGELLDGARRAEAGDQQVVDHVPFDALLHANHQADKEGGDGPVEPADRAPEDALERCADVRHLLRGQADDPARNAPRQKAEGAIAEATEQILAPLSHDDDDDDDDDSDMSDTTTSTGRVRHPIDG